MSDWTFYKILTCVLMSMAITGAIGCMVVMVVMWTTTKLFSLACLVGAGFIVYGAVSVCDLIWERQ